MFFCRSIDRLPISEDAKSFLKSLFNLKFFCLVSIPSILSFVIVAFVYSMTHEEGKLLKKFLVDENNNVFNIYDIIQKSNNEVFAIVIMGATSLISLYTLSRNKTKLARVLSIVAVAFLCREIHFKGTTTGVYVVVFPVILYCFWKFNEIIEELRLYPKLWTILPATGVSYFFSILVQRRAFKHLLPESYRYLEQRIHISLEEVSENVAHLCFLICVVILLSYSRKLNSGSND